MVFDEKLMYEHFFLPNFKRIVKSNFDKFVEFYKIKRMKYPTRRCEVCNRNLTKDQLDSSKKEYHKSFCESYQKDEWLNKALEDMVVNGGELW